MKPLVVCATIFCLELVSSFPFPEALPGYYETYEQVPQQIQLPNIARSPDLYHQQQLAYIQQQNEKRRQNYESLLRNQDLNQRLSPQILQRPSYNVQPVLNTVHKPYVNSIPLQRPIQEAQYEAPITQQYYPARNELRQYQPVQSQQYEETRTEAAGTQAGHQINNLYSQPHYPGYNVQNLAYHPRIRQVLATTPLKKRYLVLHPNGTIEHIDKIEQIVEQHPNYILVNAGNVAPKPNGPEATAQNPVNSQQPVAPVVPAIPAQSNPVPVSTNPAPVVPVAPVAPSAPVIPATVTAQDNPVPPSPTPTPVAPVAPPPSAQVNAVPSLADTDPESLTLPPVAPLDPVAPVVPTTSVAQANASPTPASTVARSNADPASPVSSPVPVTSDHVAPIAPAVPPTPALTSVVPVPPSIQNGTVPGPKPTVPPPTGTTTTLPPVSAPTAQPPIILNGTVPGPTTVPSTTNVTPTTQPPIWVTATATAVYPPPTTPLPPTTPTPTVTPVSPTATPDKATEAPVTPTTVPPYTKPCDANTDLDVLHLKNGTEPVIWFRTKDLDFWNKLTSGNELYDVVYFFNVPREPRVTKETKTTIHADGTVVEEITETIDEDEDTPPRVIKTRKVTKPDGTQSKT